MDGFWYNLFGLIKGLSLVALTILLGYGLPAWGQWGLIFLAIFIYVRFMAPKDNYADDEDPSGNDNVKRKLYDYM